MEEEEDLTHFQEGAEAIGAVVVIEAEEALAKEEDLEIEADSEEEVEIEEAEEALATEEDLEIEVDFVEAIEVASGVIEEMIEADSEGGLEEAEVLEIGIKQILNKVKNLLNQDGIPMHPKSEIHLKIAMRQKAMTLKKRMTLQDQDHGGIGTLPLNPLHVGIVIPNQNQTNMKINTQAKVIQVEIKEYLKEVIVEAVNMLAKVLTKVVIKMRVMETANRIMGIWVIKTHKGNLSN